MNYAVAYYLKGGPKQIKEFESFEEAKSFMKGLAISDNCEAFRLVKAKYKISIR